MLNSKVLDGETLNTATLDLEILDLEARPVISNDLLKPETALVSHREKIRGTIFYFWTVLLVWVVMAN